MYLIVGLGNPGTKYELTRHNVGFLVLDKLAADFKVEKKFNAEITKIDDALLIKPQTFMNLSGQAVQAVISFYKINPADLIVIHDDLDIAFGDFKIQQNRSAAGHHGVQSIIESLGTQNFTRIRIGIKNPEQQANLPTEDFVLRKFTAEELVEIEKVLLSVKDQVAEIIKTKNTVQDPSY